MATKKYKELKNLSKDELLTKVRESEKAIFEARIQHATGQLENTSKVWSLRKEIAQTKFLLSEIERNKQPAQVKGN